MVEGRCPLNVTRFRLAAVPYARCRQGPSPPLRPAVASRSASSGRSRSWPTGSGSWSTRARRWRSWCCSRSRGGRSRATSWRRCCGPNPTMRPRAGPCGARSRSFAPRSASAGSAWIGRPWRSTVPGVWLDLRAIESALERSEVGRARRRRRARPGAVPRGLLAPGQHRVRRVAGDPRRRRRPDDLGAARASRRRRRGGRRSRLGHRGCVAPRRAGPARRAGAAAPDGDPGALRRPRGRHAPVPGLRRGAGSRPGCPAAVGDDRPLRGDPGRAPRAAEGRGGPGGRARRRQPGLSSRIGARSACRSPGAMPSWRGPGRSSRRSAARTRTGRPGGACSRSRARPASGSRGSSRPSSPGRRTPAAPS